MAIDRLRSIVRPGSNVLELGAGGSTLFFLDLGANVIATESSEEWAKVVQNASCCDLADRLEIIELDSDKKDVEAEYKKKLDSVNLGLFDVIFIDFPDPDYSVALRERIFNYVEPFVKKGAFILVDDTWRYPNLLKSNRAKKIETLRSVGPARIGVTEALLFHY